MQNSLQRHTLSNCELAAPFRGVTRMFDEVLNFIGCPEQRCSTKETHLLSRVRTNRRISKTGPERNSALSSWKSFFHTSRYKNGQNSANSGELQSGEKKMQELAGALRPQAVRERKGASKKPRTKRADGGHPASARRPKNAKSGPGSLRTPGMRRG